MRLQADEEKGVVEFEATFPAHGHALELVEQGEGPLDDTAESAHALAVGGALAGDHRQDPAASQLTPRRPAIASTSTSVHV
jgi:hypothetical protein